MPKAGADGDRLMRTAGCAYTALSRIGVTTGPEPSPGACWSCLRRALALALEIPAYRVTTLDAMADAALEKIADADWPSWPPMQSVRNLSWPAHAQRARLSSHPNCCRSQTLSRTESTIMSALEPACCARGHRGRKRGALLRDAGLYAHGQLLFDQPDAVFVAAAGGQPRGGAAAQAAYLRPPDAKLPDPLR